MSKFLNLNTPVMFICAEIINVNSSYIYLRGLALTQIHLKHSAPRVIPEIVNF